MKFKPLIEVPHYEFEPLLPVVLEKIRTWKQQIIETPCANQAWHNCFTPTREDKIKTWRKEDAQASKA